MSGMFGRDIEKLFAEVKRETMRDPAAVLPLAASLVDQVSSDDQDGHVLEGQLLVGVAGRLFCVTADGSIFEQTESAIGAGRFYALGSLHSTRGRDQTARVKAAVEAAIEFSPLVAGPPVVEVLDSSLTLPT